MNGALIVLDRWLKVELSKSSWDVEAVEVKGQAPEFTWGRERYELKNYKSGQLAKLPREALSRADELRGTTRVAVDDLRRLKVPATKVESKESVVPKAADVQSPRKVVVEGAKKKVSGSIAGRHFGEDELSRLKDGYLSLAKDLLGGEVLVAKCRKVVKEEDLAIFLMILRFFSLNMNADGSLPTARWREMWTALYESGEIERAWCHHRLARMRNFLSEKELIVWEDEDFVAGVFDDEGRFVPGKAAKWHAGNDLMSRLEEVDGQQAVGTARGRDFETDAEEKLVVSGFKEGGQAHDEGREEERGILCGYKHQVQLKPDEKEEGRSILYGYTTFEIPILTPESRQSTKFLEDLDHLGIVMPLQRPRFKGYSTGQYRKAA